MTSGVLAESFRRPEQVERREVRELQPLMKDQSGFDATIGEVKTTTELWQGMSI